MKTLDNKRIFIPNGSVTAGPISNISGQGTIRVDMIFAVSGDENIDRVRASVQKAADACPLILKTPPVDILISGWYPWAETGDGCGGGEVGLRIGFQVFR